MEMKLSTKTIGLAMLTTLLVGIAIGSMLTWKCGKQKEVKVYVPDPLIALQLDGILQNQIKLRKDMQDKWHTWTFTTATGQTITVDSTTKWKDVPVIQTNFDDAFTIKVDDHPLSIDVYGYVITKGKPDSLVIRPRKTTYQTAIKEKRKIVDPYGTVVVGVNWELHPVAQAEIGMVFWDKVAIFGSVFVSEYPLEFKPFAGVKYVLF